jgi:hypothetical protein
VEESNDEAFDNESSQQLEDAQVGDGAGREGRNKIAALE